MKDKSTLFVNAYLKLTDDEKAEVLEAIKDYNQRDWFQKGRMNEDFQERTKRITGPVNIARCPTCGK